MSSTGEWKTAKAPDGRVYYYHTVTKATTYTKPEEMEKQEMAAGEWKAAKAPDGRVYYYHTATKQTTYTMPPEFKAAQEKLGEWKAAAHEGRTYYYHTVTKETTYTKPAGFQEALPAAAPTPAPAPAPAPAAATATAGAASAPAPAKKKSGKKKKKKRGSKTGLPPWTEEEFADYMAFFDDVDVNKDGLISPDEMLALASAAGRDLSMEEVLHLISSKDTNGDGVVSIKEYIAFAERSFPPGRPFFYEWLFGRYTSGPRIDMKGLQQVLIALDCPRDPRSVEAELGAKRITYEKFKAFIRPYIDGDDDDDEYDE